MFSLFHVFTFSLFSATRRWTSPQSIRYPLPGSRKGEKWKSENPGTCVFAWLSRLWMRYAKKNRKRWNLNFCYEKSENVFTFFTFSLFSLFLFVQRLICWGDIHLPAATKKWKSEKSEKVKTFSLFSDRDQKSYLDEKSENSLFSLFSPLRKHQ